MSSPRVMSISANLDLGAELEHDNWALASVTDGPSGIHYHFVQQADTDWTEEARVWLSNLDPQLIDAKMLEGLGPFQEGGYPVGTAGVIQYLMEVLGGE